MTLCEPALQIGYLVGPAPLIAAVAKAHSFLIFTVPSNLQRAVAHGLDHEESFYRYGVALHVCCSGPCQSRRRHGVVWSLRCSCAAEQLQCLCRYGVIAVLQYLTHHWNNGVQVQDSKLLQTLARSQN